MNNTDSFSNPEAEVDIDPELIQILEILLEQDENISARAVARMHTRIGHASTITRSPKRMALLKAYQARQDELRRRISRLKKVSQNETARTISERDERIVQLKNQCENLVAAHAVLFRQVCEMGGTRKLGEFYVHFREMRDSLKVIGAFSSEVHLG
jgi:hypothetical protein